MATARDAAVAALIALPHMTPSRLHRVFDRWPDPARAVGALAVGGAAAILDAEARLDPERRAAITAAWRAVDPARAAGVIDRHGTRVLTRLDPDWPIDEAAPDLPAALLVEGERADALDRPRVAIVGTRAATPAGLTDARDLARSLAECGITVVSGLAIGIDGAAHAGSLDADGPTVGVVATGLDVVYPRRHVALTTAVRQRGLVVTEHPHGTGPRPERFPVRNRIIAALADVVVVVEAAERGGALSTAAAALRLGRPVLAQPGSRRNPVAAGTNALLADGAHPLLDPADVILALGMTAGARRGPPTRPASPTPAPGPLPADARRVLRALGGEPATADELAARTGLGAAEVARAVRDLVAAGRLARHRGLLWPA
ncbi:MAG: DNA-processing protein DprA [Actinomycetes bacterium]